MKLISKYSKFVPYLYFIAVIIYLFTSLNKSEGLTAYPILLLGIPFIWQLVKPNKNLNFSLGIIFVCISSYLILAYLSYILNIISISETFKGFIVLGGLFVLTNFTMSLWMIRNSMKKAF